MVQGEAVSLVLGYTSIACWLGAQFPQIVVNWRRRSVDGLSLPFLINWFFGDSTNLIGCILTNQLPFQTYVAIYFVLVDFSLVTQYFYYDAAKDAKALSALRSQSGTSLILPSSLSYSPHSYTLPHTSIVRSRSASYSMDPQLRVAVANMSLATAEPEGRRVDLRTSDVEIGDSHARWRSFGSRRAGSLEGLPESVRADPQFSEWVAQRQRRPSDAGDGEGDPLEPESPSIMISSFYSEDGGRQQGRDKRVSWSTSRDRGGRRRSYDRRDSSSTTPSNPRGRQLARPTVSDSQTAVEESIPQSIRPRTTSTTSTVSPAAGRRGAGIVFLSVFALFGLTTHAGHRIRQDVSMQGDVLTPRPIYIPYNGPDISSRFVPISMAFTLAQPHVFSDGETQQLIGRISAWTCTTLYITSRLPQIWKNFVRKSVEGLSMYLFVFAFLGNLFYVLSILTNPKMDLPAPQAAQFLRASVPYILGSGGTLIFDVTIVLQSFLYGSRVHTTRRRRKSIVSASGEEERALLGGDAAN